MSITISLPPETEEKLRKRAEEHGQTVDGYVRQLVEHDILGVNGGQGASTAPRPVGPPPGTPLDEILAPVREEFERSGMSEEELTEFLTGVRDAVRREKRSGKAS
jgi:hypothetical protein